MAKILTDVIEFWQGCGETHTHTLLVSMQTDTSSLGKVPALLYKIKYTLIS